jgi:hypothetical protein
LVYAEYDALVHEKVMVNSPSPEHTKEDAKPKRGLPPGRKRAGYPKMFIGLLYLGLWVFFPMFRYEALAESWVLSKALYER